MQWHHLVVTWKTSSALETESISSGSDIRIMSKIYWFFPNASNCNAVKFHEVRSISLLVIMLTNKQTDGRRLLQNAALCVVMTIETWILTHTTSAVLNAVQTICARAYTRTQIHTHTHTLTHARTHARTHTNTLTRIHTRARIHTYTHMPQTRSLSIAATAFESGVYLPVKTLAGLEDVLNVRLLVTLGVGWHFAMVTRINPVYVSITPSKPK